MRVKLYYNRIIFLYWARPITRGGRNLSGENYMIVTVRNNGSPNNETGSGCGIRISWEERDKHFAEWDRGRSNKRVSFFNVGVRILGVE